MRKLAVALFVFLLFYNAGFIYGQKKAQIEAIKTYSKKILTDSALRQVIIKESDWGEGAGFLIGYYLSDSLVQISWVNAHVSIRQNDYFFMDGQFISYCFSRRTAGYKSRKYNFEEQYYYIAGKMLEIINNKIIQVKNSRRENILRTASEYKDLIIQANKEQQ